MLQKRADDTKSSLKTTILKKADCIRGNERTKYEKPRRLTKLWAD
jgi:hypothetical protein